MSTGESPPAEPPRRERLYNPGGAVYGLLTMGALLAAESNLHETYPQAVGSAAIALIVYWFAHSYSDLLGERLAEERRLGFRTMARAFARDWGIIRGASIPLLALVVLWAVGAHLRTALVVAFWVCVASLVLFEVLAGVQAKAKPRQIAIEACVGATMGLAILALRIVLH